MRLQINRNADGQRPGAGGFTGWLLGRILRRLRGEQHPGPRLEMLERISLAPRQSLALVEAEGRRFLIATSAEGAPAFFALDERARRAPGARAAARVSW
jgi:Flagellar biosynthesis protein, FliO